MFIDEPTTPVLRMIQRAAKVYKSCYGDYPEMVGLDIFSRFREWQQGPFVEQYYWREIGPMPVLAGDWKEWKDAMIPYTYVSVKIEPATFSPMKYNAYGLEPRPTDPSRGKNEVWCKRGEHEALVLLTESGWHAIA